MQTQMTLRSRNVYCSSTASWCSSVCTFGLFWIDSTCIFIKNILGSFSGICIQYVRHQLHMLTSIDVSSKKEIQMLCILHYFQLCVFLKWGRRHVYCNVAWVADGSLGDWGESWLLLRNVSWVVVVRVRESVKSFHFKQQKKIVFENLPTSYVSCFQFYFYVAQTFCIFKCKILFETVEFRMYRYITNL